jgi:hypothetical protein
MTYSALARMLKRAGRLTEQALEPDAEVPTDTAKAVTEAVSDAVEPVVEAIEDAKAIEAEGDDVNVNPPAVFVTAKPEARSEPVVKVVDDDAPAEPMTFRQAKMISWLGMVRVDNELRKIHTLTRDLTERQEIHASWDKDLASECIEALISGNAFKHPEGWTVYLNRGAYQRYRTQKAS